MEGLTQHFNRETATLFLIVTVIIASVTSIESIQLGHYDTILLTTSIFISPHQLFSLVRQTSPYRHLSSMNTSLGETRIYVNYLSDTQ